MDGYTQALEGTETPGASSVGGPDPCARGLLSPVILMNLVEGVGITARMPLSS